MRSFKQHYYNIDVQEEGFKDTLKALPLVAAMALTPIQSKASTDGFYFNIPGITQQSKPDQSSQGPIKFNIPKPASEKPKQPEQPKQSVQAPVSSQQQKELDTVIATLILEAGGEGKKGMEAVYEVILNRAKVRKKTPFQIVTQRKQFSCFDSGVERAVEKAKKHPRWALAESIVKSPVTNFTKGSTFYHTTKVNPYWKDIFLKRGAQTTLIGNHIFYTGKNLA